jgi:hypothetical protein
MEHTNHVASQDEQHRRGAGRLPGLIASVGLSLCALCCAAPLLIAAGIGSTALLAYAAIGEKVGLGLAVAAVVAYVVARYRRRSAQVCSINCATRPRKA